MRYTVKSLRADVEEYNGYLASEGILTRLEAGGHNGYQCVDEYSVDADGNRIGSGHNRNVCCGTSRECGKAVYAYYSNAYNAKRIADLEANVKELESAGHGK